MSPSLQGAFANFVILTFEIGCSMDLECFNKPHRVALALLVFAILLLGFLPLSERGSEIRVSDRTTARNVAGNYLADAGNAKELSRKGELERRVLMLISELYRDESKVGGWTTVIPGGEYIQFTQPMIDLIRLGENARPALESRIHDENISNEVALILGAIGKEETIPILIDAYPNQVCREEGARYGDDEYFSLRDKHICFTYSLTYLTGKPIGRGREGTIFQSASKQAWQAWWESCKKPFVLPIPKPTDSWVPVYDFSIPASN